MSAQTEGEDNSRKLKQKRIKCKEPGHIAQECPNREKQEQMHANIEEDAGTKEEDIDQDKNIFVQKKDGGVGIKNWVLLNSQSTVNQVTNPGLLTNIRRLKNTTTIH